MKKVTIIFILFLVASCSCSSSDDYMRINMHDEVYKNEFIKELDEVGVPYIVEGDAIKYKEEYSYEVKKALSNVNKSYPSIYTVSDKSISSRFEAELSSNNIPYSKKVSQEGKDMFVVDSKYREMAKELLERAAKTGR